MWQAMLICRYKLYIYRFWQNYVPAEGTVKILFTVEALKHIAYLLLGCNIFMVTTAYHSAKVQNVFTNILRRAVITLGALVQLETNAYPSTVPRQETRRFCEYDDSLWLKCGDPCVSTSTSTCCILGKMPLIPIEILWELYIWAV